MLEKQKLTTIAILMIAFVGLPAFSQELKSPSEWLDKLDREHDQIVSRSGHAHARGEVQAVHVGPGPATVTIVTEEMESADKTVLMGRMKMIFHVTNRRILEGIEPGDAVEFEAARLKGAIMVTNLRKVR